MGFRVFIESTGDAENPVTAAAEYFDPEDGVTAERMGQIIGYAVNAMEAFVVPRGDLIDGLNGVLNKTIFRRGSERDNSDA